MRPTPSALWADRWTGGATLEDGLRLDTPAWFTWLEAPTTTSDVLFSGGEDDHVPDRDHCYSGGRGTWSPPPQPGFKGREPLGRAQPDSIRPDALWCHRQQVQTPWALDN